MKFLLPLLILTFTSFAQAGVDNNTCRYNNDNECDDGGPNSHYSGCALGTDLNDCGPRFSLPVTFPTSTEYPLGRVKEGARLACKKAFQKNLVSDKKSCRQEVKSFIKDKEKKQKNPFLILSRLYLKNKYGKKSGQNEQQCTQLTADYNNLRSNYENAQRDWSEERNDLQNSIEDMSSEITQLVSDNSYLKSELNKYKPSNQPKSYFCYAACKYNGKADLSRVGKGTGRLRSQALAAALQNTQSKHECGNGPSYAAVEVKCEEDTYPQKTFCSAACRYNGQADTSRVGSGNGNSQAQAEFNALFNTQNNHECGHGRYAPIIMSCESD